MRVTAHQPAFLPWLGLVHKIASADVFISWDAVQMEDSGFENRNRILTANGPQWLTVPVKRDRDLKINELLICNDQPWRRKHWRSLELAYSKAPNWNHHGQFLKWLYDTEWRRLVELNDAILDYLLLQFGLQHVRRLKLSEIPQPKPKAAPPAPRSADQAKAKPEKPVDPRVQTILDAVRHAGGAHYIFGERGRDYVDKPAMVAQGVEPWIQEYRPVSYPQAGHETFTPAMCAFDLLLNVERDRAREIMQGGGTVRRMA